MSEDRLSDLPDALIHHIFSFLDMTTIARTLILGKRWRYLWLSAPVLDFDERAWLCHAGLPNSGSGHYRRRLNNFTNCLDQVLLNNSGNAHVHIEKLTLAIHNPTEPVDYPRIISWLLAASIRNVNHISLRFPVYKPMELPHQLFESNLSVLHMSFSFFKDGALVRLPNSLSTAPRITCLQLSQVLFPDGDGSRELVLSCPLLEVFDVDSCNVSNLKVLRISTPQLVSMALVNVFTLEGLSCVVKTCTPKLRWMKIKADARTFVVDYSTEDLSSLVSLDLDVDTRQEDDDRSKRWSKSLIGILNKVHNLQSLRLLSPSVQILADISELLQKLPNIFHDLKYVMLADPCEAPFHILLNIIKRFPCLETFEWSAYSCAEHVPWPEELSFDCIFDRLKSIKINYIYDDENDFLFLKLLLKNAPVLENVSVTDTCDISFEDFAELHNKLQTLPRASSNLTIHRT